MGMSRRGFSGRALVKVTLLLPPLALMVPVLPSGSKHCWWLHPEPHLSKGSLFSSPAKPKITYVENKTAMELEDQITLTCEASGDPIPSITWRTSTRNISNEEKVQPFPKPPRVLGSAQLVPACPWPAAAWGARGGAAVPSVKSHLGLEQLGMFSDSCSIHWGENSMGETLNPLQRSFWQVGMSSLMPELSIPLQDAVDPK